MHIERYNSQRLEFLKQLLTNSVENSKAPQDYEIRVDDMRVVPRTNNPELFDSYEDFITEQTRSVLVMLYEGVSRKNAKYLFHLKEEDMPKAQEKGLGEIEVAKIVKEKLEQREQQIKQEQMEKELKELKEEQKQNEKDFEKIIAHNKKLEAGRDLEDVQWGKILGAAGDTLLRSNTKFLAKIPALQGLAGIIEADTKEREKQIASPSPEPEIEASYSMKSEKNENEKKEEPEKKENKNNEKENSEQNSPTSEEERDRIGLIRQLNQRFKKTQVEQVFSLLNLLINNPKAIEPTLKDALQRKAQSSEAKSETKQQAPTESQQQKKKPEQKQESFSEKENSQVNNLEEKMEEAELTNFLVPENQKKENDFTELPVTI